MVSEHWNNFLVVMDNTLSLLLFMVLYLITAYYGTTFKIYWDANPDGERTIKGYKKYWKNING